MTPFQKQCKIAIAAQAKLTKALRPLQKLEKELDRRLSKIEDLRESASLEQEKDLLREYRALTSQYNQLQRVLCKFV
jgi:hypothetical protein